MFGDQVMPSVIKRSSNVQQGTSRKCPHSETVIDLPNQAAKSGVGRFLHTETVLIVALLAVGTCLVFQSRRIIFRTVFREQADGSKGRRDRLVNFVRLSNCYDTFNFPSSLKI